ncbi:MAG: nucleotidyltransferase domain-containing protein [Lachnospiraceae bacterium]|nr:nucleotidyltransferase domain-containing protein [Lachnospiraceae bacterium]
MVDTESYIGRLIALLRDCFGERLVYVGLQGSYLRGEATDNSDIDIMVVIDDLSVSDLDKYRATIQSLEHFDKSCGFICSKEDIANWNPLEICHLLNCTKDYFGILSELVPVYTKDDIRNFVKMSVNNMYHEICHRYIHADREKSVAKLPGTYKGVFFILQNMYYLTNGKFIATKAELRQALAGKNRAVLERSVSLNKGGAYDFAESFALLFSWCQETLKSL